jgi:hypothetical protein
MGFAPFNQGGLQCKNASVVQLFWKQNRLRRRGKIALRNGFVSGVLPCREMNRSSFGRQAPV